ncbi:MAG TPA: DUF3159 domain-containing protein [Pseudonocardia sp.]|nr:DUF3159 domain-containing protein [Pseudonocardia sp.]
MTETRRNRLPVSDEPPPPAGEYGEYGETWWSTAAMVLNRAGGASGMVVAAVPTVVFVLVNGLASLNPALVATVAAALLAFGWRLRRREPLRQAMVGLLIAGACAAIAGFTGQARGFFLVPILIPFAAIAVCLVSLLVRRPLAGLLLHRLAGGHPGRREDPRLTRLYSTATLVCVAVNVFNLAVQIALFLADQTAWLAVAHLVSPVLFGVVMVGTIVLARRIMGRGAASGSQPCEY